MSAYWYLPRERDEGEITLQPTTRPLSQLNSRIKSKFGSVTSPLLRTDRDNLDMIWRNNVAMRTYWSFGHNFVHTFIMWHMIMFFGLVKKGVRFPKFIWAPCAQLYSLAETPQPPPPSPRIWAHIRWRYRSAKIDDISLWPPGFSP